MIRVFEVIRANQPSVAIVLSNKYSIDVPGCLHIDGRDDIKKITEYLTENIDKAVDSIKNVRDSDVVPSRSDRARETGERRQD